MGGCQEGNRKKERSCSSHLTHTLRKSGWLSVVYLLDRRGKDSRNQRSHSLLSVSQLLTKKPDLVFFFFAHSNQYLVGSFLFPSESPSLECSKQDRSQCDSAKI